MSNPSAAATALAALAALATAAPAFADTYTTNAYSVPYGTNVTISDPALGISNEGGEAGGIEMSVKDTTTNITSPLMVWCSDISNYLTAPATYTLDTLTSDIGLPGYPALTPGTIAAEKMNQINALLTALAGGQISPLNAATSAALQVAIWEVLYEAGDSNYNVTAGTFFIGSYGGDNVATVEADANQYLADVTNGTWLANPYATVEQLQPAPYGADNQSLIFLANTPTPSQSAAVIPEPASLTLLATGVVGLIAARRRRKPTKPQATKAPRLTRTAPPPVSDWPSPRGSSAGTQ